MDMVAAENDFKDCHPSTNPLCMKGTDSGLRYLRN